MPKHFGLRFAFVMLCLLAFSLVGPNSCFAGQGQPQLQISAPADGTVVNPGQTISVTVVSPAGISFTYVAVIGEQPIGPFPGGPSVPATVSVTIPGKISPGKYTLGAAGRPSAGQAVFSKLILVDVERSDTPTRLNSSPFTLPFGAPGNFDYLRISGTFPDGSVVNVTESTYMSYSSSNTAVATVNAGGMVRAVAPGQAIITATYANGPYTAIPVSVAPGPVSPSPTSLSFGSQNLGTASSPQSLTFANTTHNGSLGITRVTASGDFSETDNCVSSSPLAVGATCTVSVTFVPTARGDREGYLNLQTDMTAMPTGIRLSGTGWASPNAPAIANLSPTSGVVGSSVTISGANFGATQRTSIVRFNGTAATPTSWSPTAITVPVPNGATTGQVTVTVAHQRSNSRGFIVSIPAPIVTSLSPPSAPVGTPVTISGANFGASQGSSTVGFHGILATPTSWSPTSIVVPVPAAATTGFVYIVVGGQFSNPVNFSVTPNAASPAFTLHGSPR